jgi:hypothetical protein
MSMLVLRAVMPCGVACTRLEFRKRESCTKIETSRAHEPLSENLYLGITVFYAE